MRRIGRENTPHQIRDVSLGQDRSRVRANHGDHARLRSLAFNVFAAHKTGARSLARYRAALAGFENLIALKTLLEP